MNLNHDEILTSILENANPNEVESKLEESGYIVLDGDTIEAPDGTRLRVRGFNAPETAKPWANEGDAHMGPESRAATEWFLNQGEVSAPRGELAGSHLANAKKRYMSDVSVEGLGSLAEFQVQNFYSDADNYRGGDPDLQLQERARDLIYSEGTGRRHPVKDYMEKTRGNYPTAELGKVGSVARDNRFGWKKRALARGIDNLQSGAYGLAHLAGRAAGSEDLQEWSEEGIMQQEREIAENPADVASYHDINSFADLAKYTGEKLIENAPILGSGGVGGLAARVAGKGAAKAAANKVKSRILENARSKALPIDQRTINAAGRVVENQKLKNYTRAGATAGFSVSNIGETETTQMQLDNPASPIAVLAIGAAKSALDVVGIERALGQFFLPKDVTKIRDIAKEIAKGFGAGAVGEGATETLQAGLDVWLRAQQDPSFDMFGAEAKEIYMESLVAGTVTGGAMGGFSRGAGAVGKVAEVEAAKRDALRSETEDAPPPSGGTPNAAAHSLASEMMSSTSGAVKFTAANNLMAVDPSVTQETLDRWFVRDGEASYAFRDQAAADEARAYTESVAQPAGDQQDAGVGTTPGDNRDTYNPDDFNIDENGELIPKTEAQKTADNVQKAKEKFNAAKAGTDKSRRENKQQTVKKSNDPHNLTEEERRKTELHNKKLKEEREEVDRVQAAAKAEAAKAKAERASKSEAENAFDDLSRRLQVEKKNKKVTGPVKLTEDDEKVVTNALQERVNKAFTNLGIKIAPTVTTKRKVGGAKGNPESPETGAYYNPETKELVFGSSTLEALASADSPARVAAALETVAHEMGHALDYEILRNVDQATGETSSGRATGQGGLTAKESTALDKAYNAWKAKAEATIKEKGHDAAYAGRRPPQWSQKGKDGKLPHYDEGSNSRLLRKDEWIADQVSTYLMTGKFGAFNPDNESRTIIKKIAELVRQAYKSLFEGTGVTKPMADKAVANIIEARYNAAQKAKLKEQNAQSTKTSTPKNAVAKSKQAKEQVTDTGGVPIQNEDILNEGYNYEDVDIDAIESTIQSILDNMAETHTGSSHAYASMVRLINGLRVDKDQTVVETSERDEDGLIIGAINEMAPPQTVTLHGSNNKTKNFPEGTEPKLWDHGFKNISTGIPNLMRVASDIHDNPLIELLKYSYKLGWQKVTVKQETGKFDISGDKFGIILAVPLEEDPVAQKKLTAKERKALGLELVKLRNTVANPATKNAYATALDGIREIQAKLNPTRKQLDSPRVRAERALEQNKVVTILPQFSSNNKRSFVIKVDSYEEADMARGLTETKRNALVQEARIKGRLSKNDTISIPMLVDGKAKLNKDGKPVTTRYSAISLTRLGAEIMGTTVSALRAAGESPAAIREAFLNGVAEVGLYKGETNLQGEKVTFDFPDLSKFPETQEIAPGITWGSVKKAKQKLSDPELEFYPARTVVRKGRTLDRIDMRTGEEFYKTGKIVHALRTGTKEEIKAWHDKYDHLRIPELDNHFEKKVDSIGKMGDPNEGRESQTPHGVEKWYTESDPSIVQNYHEPKNVGGKAEGDTHVNPKDSHHADSKISGTAESWLKLLGIKSRTIVGDAAGIDTYRAEVTRRHAATVKDIIVAQRKVEGETSTQTNERLAKLARLKRLKSESETLRGKLTALKEQGKAAIMYNTEFQSTELRVPFIFVPPTGTEYMNLTQLAHEFGHLVQRVAVDQLIIKAQKGNNTANEVVLDLFGDVDWTDPQQALLAREIFADRFLGWTQSNQVAKTATERFFKSVIDTLKALWASMFDLQKKLDKRGPVKPLSDKSGPAKEIQKRIDHLVMEEIKLLSAESDPKTGKKGRSRKIAKVEKFLQKKKEHLQRIVDSRDSALRQLGLELDQSRMSDKATKLDPADQARREKDINAKHDPIIERVKAEFKKVVAAGNKARGAQSKEEKAKGQKSKVWKLHAPGINAKRNELARAVKAKEDALDLLKSERNDAPKPKWYGTRRDNIKEYYAPQIESLENAVEARSVMLAAAIQADAGVARAHKEAKAQLDAVQKEMKDLLDLATRRGLEQGANFDAFLDGMVLRAHGPETVIPNSNSLLSKFKLKREIGQMKSDLRESGLDGSGLSANARLLMRDLTQHQDFVLKNKPSKYEDVTAGLVIGEMLPVTSEAPMQDAFNGADVVNAAKNSKTGRATISGAGRLARGLGKWDRAYKSVDRTLRNMGSNIAVMIARDFRIHANEAGKATIYEEMQRYKSEMYPDMVKALEHLPKPPSVIEKLKDPVKAAETEQRIKDIQKALIGQIPDEQLQGDIAEDVILVRTHFQHVFHRYGKKLNIDFTKNYFPLVLETQGKWQQDEEKIVEIFKKHGFKTKAAQELWKEISLKDGQVDPSVSLESTIAPSTRFKNQRVLDPKLQRDLSEYYAQDLHGVTTGYTDALAKRLAWQDRYGGYEYLPDGRPVMSYNSDKDKMERHWNPTARLDFMLNYAVDSDNDSMTKSQADWIRGKAMNAYKGTLGSNMNPTLRKAQAGVLTYLNVGLLGGATLTSIPDLAGIYIRLGETDGVKRSMKGLKDTLRYLKNPEYAEEAKEYASMLMTIHHGLVDHTLSSAMEVGYMPKGTKKVNDAFFKAIGLKKWTDFTRVMAVQVAKDDIKHLYRTGNTEKLARLGLKPEHVATWLADGLDSNKITNERFQKTSPAMRTAINRWVDQAIMRPDATKRPAFGSDARMNTFFYLRDFMYTFFETVLHQTITNTRDAKGLSKALPVMMLGMTVMPLAAAGYELRKMLFGKLPAAAFDIKDMTQEYYGWDYMAEVARRSGVYGPLQLLDDANTDRTRGNNVLANLMGVPFEKAVQFIDDPVKTFVKTTPLLAQSRTIRDAL